MGLRSLRVVNQLLHRWRSTLTSEERVQLMGYQYPPTASVIQKHSPSPEVVCHATGFFPKEVMISWRKDGEDVNEDVELRETLPNQDGSFQKRSILKVPAEELQKHTYTCVIQHSSLKEELVLEVPKGGGLMAIIVGVVVALVVLVAVVAGIMVWKKKNSGFKRAPVNEDSSSNNSSNKARYQEMEMRNPLFFVDEEHLLETVRTRLAESEVQMGWLLPTLTLLISKLDPIRVTSRYCKPLVDATQGALQQRFGNMLVEPEFTAAAILVPKLKTSWTSDEHTAKLGLDHIKDHLEEETSNQTPVDGSSASEEEDFFANTKPTHGQEGIKQLDGYLACKADDKEILKSFPAVCNLSLKVTTALPASAACERLFSTAGLIFSPRRTRMDSKNFFSS
ncbi:hypothetical protein QTP86_013042 [Hemibagrus guttatus]|nr:hypothetical protein QTP86_013042 [Hemibagrus guttatus]